MKVFITGGAGLIGSAIAKEHINKGDEVFIWDNRSNPYNDYSFIQGIDLYGKYLSGYNLQETLNEIQPDIISHQAAFISVGKSQYDIYNFHDNNILFTAELLEAIQLLKKKTVKIMLAGSMGPYGEGKRTCRKCGYVFIPEKQRSELEIYCPLCNSVSMAHFNDERQNLYPQSQYGVTEMAQEAMIRVFCESYGLSGVSMRYFSVYGTYCNPNNPYTGVLSIIANKLINADRVELNEDGSQTRDLIHADDIAKAHYLFTRYEGSQFLTSNIATGFSHRMNDIAHAMREHLRIDKPIVFNGKVRRGDIKDSYAKLGVASNAIGWRATTNVSEIIPIYCKFVKDNIKSFKQTDTCNKADVELKRRGLL